MAKNCEKVGTMVCNKNIYCIFITIKKEMVRILTWYTTVTGRI
jgi:hypothetical protein